ncbi:hypothetical protein EBS02_00745 [bacterium]|nr:hypothetical protein [bacterium]
MNDKVKGLILVVSTLFIFSLVSSFITILSLNVFLEQDIPITHETILACTWLTMFIKGIFTYNSRD